MFILRVSSPICLKIVSPFAPNTKSIRPSELSCKNSSRPSFNAPLTPLAITLPAAPAVGTLTPAFGSLPAYVCPNILSRPDAPTIQLNASSTAYCAIAFNAAFAITVPAFKSW